MSSPKLPTRAVLGLGQSSKSIPRILCIFHSEIIISLDVRSISMDEKAVMEYRFGQQLQPLVKDEH